MPKTLEDLLEELKLDVARWKADLPDVKRDGLLDVAAKVEEWIRNAENIIAKHAKPD